MKTDRPIIFHEPGILFLNFSEDMLDEDAAIRAKVDKILSSTEATQRRLKSIQNECSHMITERDIANNTYQCMVCGKRRLHRF